MKEESTYLTVNYVSIAIIINVTTMVTRVPLTHVMLSLQCPLPQKEQIPCFLSDKQYVCGHEQCYGAQVSTSRREHQNLCDRPYVYGYA